MTHKNIRSNDKKHKKVEKLLWVDLEMTGLDPEKDKILEVAAVVTTISLRKLDEFHVVISHSDRTLKNMSDWCKENLAKNGLITAIKRSKTKHKTAEEKLLKFLDKNFDSEVPIVLAGSSIDFDRAFITRHFKKVEKRLHYRVLDVTSFVILFRNKYKIELKSKNKNKSTEHRAMSDILTSIATLRMCMKHIKK